MQIKHRIIFKFDGAMAEHGELDGSDAEHFKSGARRLLALGAAFYTTGKVPAQAVAKTDRYHVTWSPAFTGCVVDPWTVAIAGGAIGTILGYYAIRAIDYSFAEFFTDSVEGCLSQRDWSPPPVVRIEPIFSPLDRGNAPFIDLEVEDRSRGQLLRYFTRRALIEVAKPVGRSADVLEIFVDDRKVAELNAAKLRRLANEDAISEYVDFLRNRTKLQLLL